MFKRSLIVLGTVVLLQGCAAAVVAGTAGAVTAANDRRTIGSQIDDNNIEQLRSSPVRHTLSQCPTRR